MTMESLITPRRKNQEWRDHSHSERSQRETRLQRERSIGHWSEEMLKSSNSMKSMMKLMSSTGGISRRLQSNHSSLSSMKMSEAFGYTDILE